MDNLKLKNITLVCQEDAWEDQKIDWHAELSHLLTKALIEMAMNCTKTDVDAAQVLGMKRTTMVDKASRVNAERLVGIGDSLPSPSLNKLLEGLSSFRLDCEVKYLKRVGSEYRRHLKNRKRSV